MDYINKNTGQNFSDWLRIHLITNKPQRKHRTDLKYNEVIKVGDEWRRYSGDKYTVTLPDDLGRRTRLKIHKLKQTYLVAGDYHTLFDKFLGKIK